MALHLVLLTLTLAVSLVSTQHCASSAGSRVDLFLHGHKNATGHWIITVDNRRFTSTENQWEIGMNVHQERSCDSNEIEHLVSVTSVFPPLHDTATSQDMEGATASTATPFTTTTTTSTTTTPATTTTTSTTSTPSTGSSTAKSCPHSGYRVFRDFNCYKGYNEGKNWAEARKQCKGEGGDLMVAETERERTEVYSAMYESVSSSEYYPWIGVYIPQDEDGWISVNGEPALSTWWEPGQPVNSAASKCAKAEVPGLLWNVVCTDRRPFICEIPL